MRVSRSLTIKQMAMVAAVAVVFTFVFIVIQLFHFVQQNRYDIATQMEKIAHSVRIPLSAAILKADIPQAEEILNRIQPSGIISRADVVLPNQFQALRVSFIQERQIPVLVARLFELPVQISLPLYSLERPANPQPLAYLVLQADSWRAWRFILSTFSTLLTTYLLLVLILTVSISWCINRLVVHPVRHIARELDNLSPQEVSGHQLRPQPLHHDDEIGMLVRGYNRNQQLALRYHERMATLSTRDAVTDLPNEVLMLALLEQMLRHEEPGAVMIVTSETLQSADSVLTEEQREVLLLSLVARMKAVLPARMVLAQLNNSDFGIIAYGVSDPLYAMTLARQVMEALQRLPIHSARLEPAASIGIAMFKPGLSAEQFYRSAVSAALLARREGNNQIQFFDKDRVERRLTEKHEILSALENRQFAIWLQPQVDMRTREVVGAQALLSMRQPDGGWSLPEGMSERIETCGLAARVGNWILEEGCRTLAAWQCRGIDLPLCVGFSAQQLLDEQRTPLLPELLKRYHIEPARLILDVTHNRRFDDPQAAAEALRPLRNAGVSIALDDFAVGYAGLRHLSPQKAVPIARLKIGKRFIDGLPEDNAMVDVMITMAAKLGLQVVAEGVENEAQRNWLLEAGVIVALGPLFAPAQTPEAFEYHYFSAKV